MSASSALPSRTTSVFAFRVDRVTQGKPYAVLPASQVVRFIAPRYVQDDPALAGVLNDSRVLSAALGH